MKLKLLVRLLQSTIIAVALLSLGGCGTMAGLSGQHVSGQAFGDCECVPNMYGGTAIDACVVFVSKWGDGAAGWLMYDLPFSLVADTVVLPITFVKQISEGNNCPHQV